MEEIERFTHVDYLDRLALIAEVDGRLAAVARYERPPAADRAEVAFVVADAIQGLGLGTLLLEHLAAAARRQGITSFYAETLGSNAPMLDVFAQTGFRCLRTFNQGVVDVSFQIAVTGSYLEAVLGRDVHAVGAWLQPGLQPTGGGALGVVCRSSSTAAVMVAALESRGVGVSTMVVTEDAGIDVYTGLAYLAGDSDTAVIAVESEGLERSCRLVALGRFVTRRKPVVVLERLAAGGQRWAQAGVERRDALADWLDRISQLVIQQRRGIWSPPARGGAHGALGL